MLAFVLCRRTSGVYLRKSLCCQFWKQSFCSSSQNTNVVWPRCWDALKCGKLGRFLWFMATICHSKQTFAFSLRLAAGVSVNWKISFSVAKWIQGSSGCVECKPLQMFICYSSSIEGPLRGIHWADTTCLPSLITPSVCTKWTPVTDRSEMPGVMMTLPSTWIVGLHVPLDLVLSSNWRRIETESFTPLRSVFALILWWIISHGPNSKSVSPFSLRF